jgi:hypothetical protein
MSSFGKLKERMVDYLDHNQQGLIIPSDISDGLFEILDEAAKEFPKYYLRYENDRSSGKYPTYEEFQEWFKKWFGDSLNE